MRDAGEPNGAGAWHPSPHVPARQRGARCQQAGAGGGNGLISHFLCIVHLNNNKKAIGLNRAGIMRRSGDVSMCKRLIKIETQDTSTDANYLGWQIKESNFPSELITCLVEGADRRRRGLAGSGTSREGTRWPLPRSPPSPWAGTAVPEAVPMHTGAPSIPAWGPLEGHSLQTGLGTGQRGRQPLPRPPQGAGKGLRWPCRDQPCREGSSTHRTAMGCLDGSTPGEEREAWGCSAPALKDAEGFGRTTGGIWRVVLAGLSGRRRADSGKDRGLLAGGSREGHTVSSG